MTQFGRKRLRRLHVKVIPCKEDSCTSSRRNSVGTTAAKYAKLAVYYVSF